jgi:hypothetical protein
VGAFYWASVAIAEAVDKAWGLVGGTYFYLPPLSSATAWDTTADYTFNQSDLWFSKVSGTACDPHDFKGVAEAPEDYDLLPSQIDILPPETQVDNEDWTSVVNQNIEADPGWTIVSSGDS